MTIPTKPKRPPATISAAQQRDLARIDRYIDLFDRFVTEREEHAPYWRVRTLLWVLESSLRVLQRALRSRKHVRWNSPFWAFQYPVEWDWEKWRWNKSELAIRYGQLTSRNTRTRISAVRTLAEMSVRQQIYTTLQYLTHEVSTYKNGRYQHPMVPEPLAETVRSIGNRRQRLEILEQLFFPFSIGAAEIELPEGLKPGQKIPKRLAEQLARATRAIDVPEFICPMTSDGHAISVRIIFQVFPLTIDDRLKRVYFPITVGVTITSDPPLPLDYKRPPKWLDPEQWSERERAQFWGGITRFLRHQHDALKQPANDPVTKEVEAVTTKMEIEMEAISPEAVQRSANQVLDALRAKGFLKGYKINAAPAIAPAAVAEKTTALMETVEHAKDASTKGHALEDLMFTLLAAVPGFEVEKRIRTITEEIDLKVLNSHTDPRWRDNAIILFECKNWSKVCGKDEVVLFERKLENRRGRVKLGFFVSWRGFAKTVPKELLRGSRGRVQVALVTGDDLRAAARTGNILPVLRAAVDRADAN